MLAAELALAGVEAAIVEPRLTQDVSGTRARGLHSRTIEVLDQRGIADRFLDAGRTAQVAAFAWIPLDISDFPTRHNYGLALSQVHVERLLAEWAAELGVRILRGRSVESFAERDDSVEIRLSDASTLSASFLVGCDGGRSLVRKTAGIGFPGWEASVSNLIAEVRMEQEPEWGLRHDERGVHGISRLDEPGMVQVLVTEQDTKHSREPSLADLSRALKSVYGSDFGVHSPRSLSRFTDTTRQADSYRKGRVLLAGDAAHVHYPAGGQGLNIGIQDAVNLGWKLARVVSGQSPDTLLDSYHSERHPVAARALRNTMAQVALLGRRNVRKDAARELLTTILAMSEPRKWLAGMISGLDVTYDLGPGHALLGRRMPDLDVSTANGPQRVYELLHGARPVLLGFDDDGAPEAAGLAERLQIVKARYKGPWELPVIGPVDAPEWLLIRPDGHVAWVGDRHGEGLAVALALWFGPQGG
jgi:3-(3-hydroxy-phenyl)propionate hydroxylase